MNADHLENDKLKVMNIAAEHFQYSLFAHLILLQAVVVIWISVQDCTHVHRCAWPIWTRTSLARSLTASRRHPKIIAPARVKFGRTRDFAPSSSASSLPPVRRWSQPVPELHFNLPLNSPISTLRSTTTHNPAFRLRTPYPGQ